MNFMQDILSMCCFLRAFFFSFLLVVEKHFKYFDTESLVKYFIDRLMKRFISNVYAHEMGMINCELSSLL